MQPTKIYTKVIAFILALLLLAIVIIPGAVLPGIGASENGIDDDIMARAFILIEAETGTVLRARNEHERIYPASMVKILTAVLLMENLDLNEIYIAGDEITQVPWDSSLAGHVAGEAVSGENLLRSIIMPSGNDTANMIALQTMLARTGEENMSFIRAEAMFADLMTERARELGAVNSRFTNAHGYHDPNKFTTVYDMSLIAKKASSFADIMRIAGELSFSGPSAVSDNPYHQIAHYRWETRNQLIRGGVHGYPFATGMRTGWHDQAGPSVVATASRGGVDLIAVISNSPDVADENGVMQPSRWNDARILFEYGFNNYSHQTLNNVRGEIGAANAAQGQEPFVTFSAQTDGFSLFLPNGEMGGVQTVITFNPELIAETEEYINHEINETNEKRLIAPIAEGDIIGEAAFYLNGERIFAAALIAENEVIERVFATDVDHIVGGITDMIFSVRAIPFWLGGGTVLLLIIYIKIKISANRRERNDYTLSKRY